MEKLNLNKVSAVAKQARKENENINPSANEEKLKPLTPEEQAIAARVAAEGLDWQTLTEGDLDDYSLAKDPFELPVPAKEKQDKKEFFFRWITRDQRRLDEMRSKQPPFKYWICNSTNTPFLREFLDPVLGCVCREDQMLVFKPWWMHVKELEYKAMLARNLDRSGDITQKNGQKSDGYKWAAGKRSIEDDPTGTEVRGSDLIMADIEAATGKGVAASEAEMTVSE